MHPLSEGVTVVVTPSVVLSWPDTIRQVKRTVSLAVVVAALWAAAIVAWVDAWPTVMQRESASAPALYAPPRVEVADGVEGVDQAEVAAFVEQVVNDPRGWRTNLDQFTLRVVEPGIGGTTAMSGTAHIGVAHDATDTVLVTDEAWTTLGPKFAAAGGTLEDQRTWIVLHELGHMLGHPHIDCTGSGPAPVMRGTNWKLGGCSYNVWPNPWPHSANTAISRSRNVTVGVPVPDTV